MEKIKKENNLKEITPEIENFIYKFLFLVVLVIMILICVKLFQLLYESVFPIKFTV